MQTDRVVAPEGKVVYYRSDGSGRDTYIRNHNGGLLTKDKIHKLCQLKPPHEKKLSFSKTKYGKHPYEYNQGAANKFVHYISDGSGRDFYVGLTNGGNSTPFRWRNQTQEKFRSSLRDHQKLPNYNPENSDIYMQSQSRFVGTNEKFHRTMSSMQSNQALRLSEAKKTPVPPAVKTYFDQQFDQTREFRKREYGINH